MKKDTRREFIAKSTAAVAGVSVGLQAFGSKKAAAFLVRTIKSAWVLSALATGVHSC
jgi:hypothetical protein